MFLFDETDIKIFHPIRVKSLCPGFAKSDVSVRGPPASLMVTAVPHNTIGILGLVLRQQAPLMWLSRPSTSPNQAEEHNNITRKGCHFGAQM